MYPSVIKQKLMHEIDLLPENKLSEVYDFAHYLRLAVKKQNKKNKDLLSFAGSWSDMPDEEFDLYLSNISDRRKKAFGSRRNSEAGTD